MKSKKKKTGGRKKMGTKAVKRKALVIGCSVCAVFLCAAVFVALPLDFK